MNHYFTSTGERLTKAEVNRRVSEAKRDLFACLAGDYNLYCNAGIEPDRSDWRTTHIDASHTISVKRCQELRKTELAWDWANIEPMSRYAHQLWENKEANWGRVRRFNNFDRMIEYIAKHDPQQYARLMIIEEELSTNVSFKNKSI